MVKYKCNVPTGGHAVAEVTFNIISVDRHHRNPAKCEAFAMNVVARMLRWLAVAYSRAQPKCARRLEVFLYDTGCRKESPASDVHTLSTQHVNSAFADVCARSGEVVVFRREEWFKVFIHETFHALGMDYTTMDLHRFDKILRSIYHLDIEYAAQEMYAETWARILNACYLAQDSAYSGGGLKMAYSLLEIERLHAISQSHRILNRMGLSYQTLVSREREVVTMKRMAYKEETSVFSYYVATAVLLSQFPAFLQYCDRHNSNLFDFTKKQSNTLAFATFFADMATSDGIPETVDCLMKKRGVRAMRTTSMMMSCLDWI